ncbi:hypothetical protein NITHO_1300003 [Nitrolancea hollandica Lb]|uniref:Uncharacterized protein n=1 Tax=Nitrolancea hollandica Lb TaxID=1129897 RepID=I4ED06_9BACT|nr:hypothetical protein NITHO_1300003 [Nitrolancea hollandica Lb]
MVNQLPNPLGSACSRSRDIAACAIENLQSDHSVEPTHTMPSSPNRRFARYLRAHRLPTGTRRSARIDGRPRLLGGGSGEPDVEDARCLNGPGDLLASCSIVKVPRRTGGGLAFKNPGTVVPTIKSVLVLLNQLNISCPDAMGMEQRSNKHATLNIPLEDELNRRVYRLRINRGQYLRAKPEEATQHSLALLSTFMILASALFL